MQGPSRKIALAAPSRSDCRDKRRSRGGGPSGVAAADVRPEIMGAWTGRQRVGRGDCREG